jgi:DNA replication protein DnaC
MTDNDLAQRLHTLALRATAAQLSDLVARATKERLGPVQMLEVIAGLEETDRSRRSLERRMQCSKLGRFKSMADFDWAWPSRIDRERVEAALRLEFIESARNVVLVAPQGLGKTMIAQNIAHEAILKGHSVLFTTAAQLLLDLGGQDSARGLDKRLRHYTKQGLLVIDEVGYLAFDNRNADLLFQVITRRYERKSLVLTTNLAFREWPSIFPNATCATALIDRVIHHADVIAIEGKSYRLRQAEGQAKASRTKKT